MTVEPSNNKDLSSERIAEIRERLEQIDNDSTSHVGGSGGRYKCRYCLRESFSESRNGDAEHYNGCIVFALREANLAFAAYVRATEAESAIAVLTQREQRLKKAVAGAIADLTHRGSSLSLYVAAGLRQALAEDGGTT